MMAMTKDAGVPDSNAQVRIEFSPLRVEVEAARCHKPLKPLTRFGVDKVLRMTDTALAEIGNLGRDGLRKRVSSDKPLVSVRVELTDAERILLIDRYDRRSPRSRLSTRLWTLVSRAACKSEVCTIEMQLIAEHWDFIQSTMVSVEQEKTQRIAVASCPMHSRMVRMMRNSGIEGTQIAKDVYRWGLHFIAASVAESRVTVLHKDPVVVKEAEEPADEMPPFPWSVPSPTAPAMREVRTELDNKDFDARFGALSEGLVMDVQDAYGAEGFHGIGHAFKNRISTAADRDLRKGVTVKIYTEDVHQDLVERGRTRAPLAMTTDEPDFQRDTICTGPMLADVTAPLDSNSHINERKALCRHLSAQTKIKPSPDAVERQKVAWAIMTRAITLRFDEALYYPEAALPKKWSEGMRDLANERMSETGELKLQGFVKPREIGLPETKLPRAIGNPGTDAAARWASRVSVFEHLFCALFPSFMMKGLTQEEQDEKVMDMIQANPEMEWGSIDFSAMDSSWTLPEKKEVVKLVRDISAIFVASQDVHVETLDPSDLEKVKWYFRTLAVHIPIEDCILFSGERGTSIFNRLLVLNLRTSEIIRKLGVSAAEDFWQARWTKAEPDLVWEASDGDLGRKKRRFAPAWLYDIGDGDDSAFNNFVHTVNGKCRFYEDAQDAIDSYKAYGKTIEPVLAVGKIEILSRFSMETKGANARPIHLVKMPKNLQRLCMSTVDPRIFDPDQSSYQITRKLYAQLATTALTRAIAARYTMGFRWLAFHLGAWHAEHAGEDAMMAFSDEWEASQWEQRTLKEFVVWTAEQLQNTEVSAYAMVEWTHFGKEMPRAKDLKAWKAEWHMFEDSARELEFCQTDFTEPLLVLERLDLSRRVAECVGIKPQLLTCCGVGLLAERVPEPTPGKRESAKSGENSGEAGPAAKATARNPDACSPIITPPPGLDPDDRHGQPFAECSVEDASIQDVAVLENTVGMAKVESTASAAPQTGKNPSTKPPMQCHHCGGPHKVATCPTAPKKENKGKGKGGKGGKKGKGKGKGKGAKAPPSAA